MHFIRRLRREREVTIEGTIEGNRANLDGIADIIIKEASPAVLDAAVSWRTKSGLLAAFVTLVDESMGDVTGFLRRLRARMPVPTYMIPDVILPVNSLPKTFSGRKDFHAIDMLPLPEGTFGRTRTDSFSPFEMRVKSIWESVVGKDQVPNLKPESEFFCAGGSSLLLMHLQTALHAELCCNLSLPDLFQFRTIRSMAACIQGRA